ncbi:low molecular weight protein arginine phosphatase, partial [bacterium]
MNWSAEERIPAVLFVCTANICRSPMAVALFRAILAENGYDPRFWRIESAGTWAPRGKPAAVEVVALLAARGLNVKAHRSRSVSAELLSGFHLILTMEAGQKEALQVEFRPLEGKVFTLAEMAGENGAVEDPTGGPPEAYAQA